MFKPPTLVSLDVVGVTIAKIGLIVVRMSLGYQEFSVIQIVYSVYQVHSDAKPLIKIVPFS